jgi:hypothetical protein
MNPLNGKYYTSFSGADITAVAGTQVFATLQAISYSVTREKGPVYTMGSADPRAFARGKRAIAGTLVFVTIDKSALYGHFQDMGGDSNKFYGNKTDIRYDKLSSTDQNWIDGSSPFNVTDPMLPASGAGSEKVEQEINYSDQILPFDINLSAANEYGQVMKRSFIGVEVLNEGGGVSIDDLVIEEQYTWICRFMTPWVKVTTAARSLNLGSNIAPSNLA